MNAAANDDTHKPNPFATPNEAFGSSMNDDLPSESENDVPF
jgi:replicative DNA helicase